VERRRIQYYIGVQYVLCQAWSISWPCSAITNRCLTTAGADPQVLTITLQKLFGAITAARNLRKINFYRGTATQGSDPYLSAKQTAVRVFPPTPAPGMDFCLSSRPATLRNETITIKATTISGASCTSV